MENAGIDSGHSPYGINIENAVSVENAGIVHMESI